jgi:DNA-binding NarL/FixJ family response regulator
VAVVDDHPLLKEGVAHVLSQEEDIEVVGTGGTADEAVEIAQHNLPDIMLLDMNMPGGGLHALARIAESCPAVRTIILTVRDDPDSVNKALLLGARAYILKGIGAADLISTVRTVYEGGSFVSTSLAAKLIEDLDRDRKASPQANPGLTPREEQILRLIGRGLSNKEIGRQLDLKEKTIKHYVTNVLQKLQVRNRVEAAVHLKSRLPASD